MTATDPQQVVRELSRPLGPTADALGQERDFLLRSLADLESERRAGELSTGRFQELHDRYTVEAATVLRALERLAVDTAIETPPPPSRRMLRRFGGVAIVVAVVSAGGVFLVRAVGERQPGQTITGNAQSIVAADDLDGLARAAKDRPTDPAAHLAYASALLEAGKLVDALRAFDTAARLDPADPMPKAYGGWIVALAGLTDEALSRLDAAVATDPSYPDARFFRGMTLLRGRNDRAAASVELREYLRLAPNGPERDQVQAILDELEAETAASPR